jgi:glycosyltransferase involved in cell wall biosynthesis
VQKKKILIFIDWYLPGYKAGGPIQSVANLVQHFKDEFDFSIVTRDTDYCETTPYTSVKSDEWNKIEGVNIFYISQKNLSRKTIKSIIRKTEFDTVYLNGIFSLYFTLLPLILLRKKHNKRIVIAARGMFAESALGVKKTKKAFFLRAVKVINLFDKVTFHATNEIEKKDIHNVLGQKYEVRVAPNLPQKNTVFQLPKREKNTNTLRLVNIARIAPEKNLLYALQALKNVTSNVEFDFYGPVYNQDYWNQCKAAMDVLPQNVRAIYKGSIESDKVLGVLSGYHFLFMPTQGENFGHIILQSLMTGCPVIISNQTPWKDLANKNIGWDFALENLDAFTRKIDELTVMNQEDYNKLSASAFDYANRYLDNAEIIDRNRYLFL